MFFASTVPCQLAIRRIPVFWSSCMFVKDSTELCQILFKSKPHYCLTKYDLLLVGPIGIIFSENLIIIQNLYLMKCIWKWCLANVGYFFQTHFVSNCRFVSKISIICGSSQWNKKIKFNYISGITVFKIVHITRSKLYNYLQAHTYKPIKGIKGQAALNKELQGQKLDRYFFKFDWYKFIPWGKGCIMMFRTSAYPKHDEYISEIRLE